jgi:gamma-glutamylcysteine synthetase
MQIALLEQQLAEYFQTQSEQLSLQTFPTKILQQIEVVKHLATPISEDELHQRLLISLNNILKSIGHVSNEQVSLNMNDVEVAHG